jgi:large subunit ribosomal protein LP0
MFSVDVLDIDEEQIRVKFLDALTKVAALSLALGYPTQASLPHTIGNAFKTIIAVAVGLETYSFKEAEPFKAFLADPSAFVVAAPAAAPSAAPASVPAAGAPAPAVVPEKPKEEEVDALDGGMDMFGGGGGGGGDY